MFFNSYINHTSTYVLIEVQVNSSVSERKYNRKPQLESLATFPPYTVLKCLKNCSLDSHSPAVCSFTCSQAITMRQLMRRLSILNFTPMLQTATSALQLSCATPSLASLRYAKNHVFR